MTKAFASIDFRWIGIVLGVSLGALGGGFLLGLWLGS